MSSAKRKPEDCAEGCRLLEQNDRDRAAAIANEHMRVILERSADAWGARAKLLDRLETNFSARAALIQGDQSGRRPGSGANG